MCPLARVSKEVRGGTVPGCGLTLKHSEALHGACSGMLDAPFLEREARSWREVGLLNGTRTASDKFPAIIKQALNFSTKQE